MLPNRELLTSDLLLSVSKPARYIGTELNAKYKDKSKVNIQFALCFPDVYEIGMSHLGIKILYHILNGQEDVFCERCFTPWPDMQDVMRRQGIRLYGLESKTPLDEFDIIGFSLQYELGYTNVLKMLEIAGVPLLAKERINLPLVIAGGPCCLNPEPMAEFFDLFVLGEAEEAIVDIIGVYREFKKKYLFSPTAKNEFFIPVKKELLNRFARIEGIYVPIFYTPQKNSRPGSNLVPITEDIPSQVKKRYIKDINTINYPADPIVPFIEIVHDRVSLEIMRGCPHKCRFCQAGFTQKPFRFRKLEDLIALAKQTINRTGYEKVSFCALSSADYPYLKELINNLQLFCKEKGVALSLPSLRVDQNFLGVLALVSQLKKTGLTFAPEAGSLRLRSLLNKKIEVNELKKIFVEAYRLGWQRLKLYFMIGIPTETEEDLKAIVDLVNELSAINTAEKAYRGKISVSISNFIPKPHTPFQWLAMTDIDSLYERQNFLKSRLLNKNLDVNFYDPRMSFLETLLSRGGRCTAEVILKAYELGAQFDAWNNFFKFDIWQQAFSQYEKEIKEYVNLRYDVHANLPWEHIACGISKQVLRDELLACKI